MIPRVKTPCTCEANVNLSQLVCNNIISNARRRAIIRSHDSRVLYDSTALTHLPPVSHLSVFSVTSRLLTTRNTFCRTQSLSNAAFYPPFAERIGEVFILLYVFFVCSVNDFSTTRGPIHAKGRMQAYSGSGCVFSPFGGWRPPAGRKRGK